MKWLFILLAVTGTSSLPIGVEVVHPCDPVSPCTSKQIKVATSQITPASPQAVALNVRITSDGSLRTINY
jgi:hypothetical protein